MHQPMQQQQQPGSNSQSTAAPPAATGAATTAATDAALLPGVMPGHVMQLSGPSLPPLGNNLLQQLSTALTTLQQPQQLQQQQQPGHLQAAAVPVGLCVKMSDGTERPFSYSDMLAYLLQKQQQQQQQPQLQAFSGPPVTGGLPDPMPPVLSAPGTLAESGAGRLLVPSAAAAAAAAAAGQVFSASSPGSSMWPYQQLLSAQQAAVPAPAAAAAEPMSQAAAVSADQDALAAGLAAAADHVQASRYSPAGSDPELQLPQGFMGAPAAAVYNSMPRDPFELLDWPTVSSLAGPGSSTVSNQAAAASSSSFEHHERLSFHNHMTSSKKWLLRHDGSTDHRLADGRLASFRVRYEGPGGPQSWTITELGNGLGLVRAKGKARITVEAAEAAGQQQTGQDRQLLCSVVVEFTRTMVLRRAAAQDQDSTGQQPPTKRRRRRQQQPGEQQHQQQGEEQQEQQEQQQQGEDQGDYWRPFTPQPGWLLGCVALNSFPGLVIKQEPEDVALPAIVVTNEQLPAVRPGPVADLFGMAAAAAAASQPGMLAGMLAVPALASAAAHGLSHGLLPGGQLGWLPPPAAVPSAPFGTTSAAPYGPPVINPGPVPSSAPALQYQSLPPAAAADAASGGGLQAHTPSSTAAAAAAAAGTVLQTVPAVEGPAAQDWLFLPSSQLAAGVLQTSPPQQLQPSSLIPFSSPGLFDGILPEVPWDLPVPEQLHGHGDGLYGASSPIGRVSEAGELLHGLSGDLDIDLLLADDGCVEAADDDVLQSFAAATAAGAATAAEACKTAAGVPVCLGTGDSGSAGGSRALTAAAAAAGAAAAATAAATESGMAGSGRPADGAGMGTNTGSGSNTRPQSAASGHGHGSTANTAGYDLSTTEAPVALSSSRYFSTHSSSVASTSYLQRVLRLLESSRQLVVSDMAAKSMAAAFSARGPAEVAELLAGKTPARALLRLQQQQRLWDVSPLQLPAGKGVAYRSESGLGLQALVAAAAEGAGRARSLQLHLPSAAAAAGAGFEEETCAGECDQLVQDVPAPMWEAAATVPAAAASPGAEAPAGQGRVPVLPELPQRMEHWSAPEAVLPLMTWLLSCFAAHRWLSMAVLQVMPAVAATQLLLLYLQQVVSSLPLLLLLQAERQMPHWPQGTLVSKMQLLQSGATSREALQSGASVSQHTGISSSSSSAAGLLGSGFTARLSEDAAAEGSTPLGDVTRSTARAMQALLQRGQQSSCSRAVRAGYSPQKIPGPPGHSAPLCLSF